MCSWRYKKDAINGISSPLLEITYNWPDKNGNLEPLSSGRNFWPFNFSVDNIYDFCKKLLKEGVTINRPPRDGYMHVF